jgi:hypothetical protein
MDGKRLFSKRGTEATGERSSFTPGGGTTTQRDNQCAASRRSFLNVRAPNGIAVRTSHVHISRRDRVHQLSQACRHFILYRCLASRSNLPCPCNFTSMGFMANISGLLIGFRHARCCRCCQRLRGIDGVLGLDPCHTLEREQDRPTTSVNPTLSRCLNNEQSPVRAY